MASLKRLLYVFIPILAILLMSHNANAFSFNSPSNLNYSYAYSGLVWYGWSPDAGSAAMHNVVGIDNNGGGISFAVDGNNEVNYVTRIVLAASGGTGGKSLVFVPYRICYTNPDELKSWIGFSGNGYATVISDEKTYTSAGCMSGNIVIYTNSSIQNLYLGGPNGGSVAGYSQYGFSIVFGKLSRILLSDDADYTSVLNAIKNNTDDIKTKLDEIADSADAALDREQSETQDAADNASSSGSSSAASAEAATSSLISVIGGFVNVLTTATPTNCKINANLNHIDIGQLDLCANPVPSYIQIIGSIILICAAIPLAIVLFNRFIGLFRSFQG